MGEEAPRGGELRAGWRGYPVGLLGKETQRLIQRRREIQEEHLGADAAPGKAWLGPSLSSSSCRSPGEAGVVLLREGGRHSHGRGAEAPLLHSRGQRPPHTSQSVTQHVREQPPLQHQLDAQTQVDIFGGREMSGILSSFRLRSGDALDLNPSVPPSASGVCQGWTDRFRSA